MVRGIFIGILIGLILGAGFVLARGQPQSTILMEKAFTQQELRDGAFNKCELTGARANRNGSQEQMFKCGKRTLYLVSKTSLVTIESEIK